MVLVATAVPYLLYEWVTTMYSLHGPVRTSIEQSAKGTESRIQNLLLSENT